MTRVRVTVEQPGATLVQQRPTLIKVSPQPTTLVAVSQTGSPGVQGPPGVAGGTGITVPAGVALSGHTAVRLVGGVALPASASVAAHATAAIGITLNAAALDAPVTIAVSGPVSEPAWAWTPGALVFLGDDGAITQAAPVAPRFLRVIGAAMTPSSVLLGNALTVQQSGG